MQTSEIMDTIKKAYGHFHTVLVYERLPDMEIEICFMEFYEYRNKDDVESLYGYDVEKELWRDVAMSSIVEISDSGHEFKPQRSAPTIHEYP